MNPELTQIEKELLYAASMGKSAKTYALNAQRSYHTVQTQRKMLLKKMKCANITQACSLAIRLGYIA